MCGYSTISPVTVFGVMRSGFNVWRRIKLRSWLTMCRNPAVVRKAAEGIQVIFHLASQVAVTTSVTDPRTDFEINALGTLNALEAARLSPEQPPVFYTSTNKVYGGMEDLGIDACITREIRLCGSAGRSGRIASAGLPLPIRLFQGNRRSVCARLCAYLWASQLAVFRMSCISGSAPRWVTKIRGG